MKRKLQIIIVLCVLAFNTILIFGQGRVIDKKEYAEVTENVNNALKRKLYRSIYTVDVFTNRNSTPTRILKITTESASPMRYRMIIERNIEKREIIRIGREAYTRVNDGEWQKDENSNLLGEPEGDIIIEEESYKLYEDNELNGKKVNLYEKIVKITDSRIGGGKENQKEIHTERYWITKDSLLVKKDYEYENLGTKSLRRTTTIYEYDSSIKIEVPIK